jgi:acetyltransferase-like isoleucine patch superfamily enzyme
MNKLFIFSDNSSFALTAMNLAHSLGFIVDSFSIEGQKIDSAISNKILLALKGCNIFIAADEKYFNLLRVSLLRVFSLGHTFNIVNLIDLSSTISNSVNLGKNVFIGKNVVLSENVYIEDGVIIEEGAVILANVFLSKGSFIGSNSVIGPNSHIGSHSVIGRRVHIESINVGSKCKVLNEGRYNLSIPPNTSYIENHFHPIVYVENSLI